MAESSCAFRQQNRGKASRQKEFDSDARQNAPADSLCLELKETKECQQHKRTKHCDGYGRPEF